MLGERRVGLRCIAAAGELPHSPSGLSWELKLGRTAVPNRPAVLGLSHSAARRVGPWLEVMALNSLLLANSSSGVELAFRNSCDLGQSNFMFLESNNRSLSLHFVCLFNFIFLIFYF